MAKGETMRRHLTTGAALLCGLMAAATAHAQIQVTASVDTTTRGDWRGVYGDCFVLLPQPAPLLVEVPVGPDLCNSATGVNCNQYFGANQTCAAGPLFTGGYASFAIFRNSISQPQAFAWSYCEPGTLCGPPFPGFPPPLGSNPGQWDIRPGSSQWNPCLARFQNGTFDNDSFGTDPLIAHVGLGPGTGGTAKIAYYMVEGNLECRTLRWRFYVNGTEYATGIISDMANGKYLVFDVTGLPDTGYFFALSTQFTADQPGCGVSDNSIISSVLVSGTNVCAAPTIGLECPHSSGQVGVPYNSALVATGGVPPYTFSIIAGSLPPGLTLNPMTGAITGTPTTAGTFPFTAQVVDSTGSPAGTTTKDCSITIGQPNVTIIKFTNGFDANNPDGADVPNIVPGGAVTWTYRVTNTGSIPVPRADVIVTDDTTGVTPSFLSELAGNGDLIFDPGEVWLYQATGIALDLLLPPPGGVHTQPGVCTHGGTEPPRTAYTNIGTVTIPGATASDPSSYCNPPVPNVAIIKFTNGADANDPNGAGVHNVVPGGPVTWTYHVTNTGNVAVPMAQVVVTDNTLGVTPVFVSVLLGNADAILDPGEVWLYQAMGIALDLTLPPPPGVHVVPNSCTAGGTQPPRTAYTNIGTVTIPGATASDPSSYCNPPPPACDLTVQKTCEIPAPPPAPFVCSDAKPINSLSMRWAGTVNVNIKAYKGSVGSALLTTINNITPGQVVTVTGYAGAPNDVFWEVFNASTGAKIGESKFHISCSDADMNGPEDCGKLQGNGKDEKKDGGKGGNLVNLWDFEGMAGNGKTLSCTPPPPPPGTSSCALTPGPSPNCTTEGKPVSLSFNYSGGTCGATTNTQGGKATCTGAIDPLLPVTITAKSKDGTKTYTLSSATADPGDDFTVSVAKAGDFAADSVIKLSNAGGTMTIGIHTSCSKQLEAGDVFGALTLVAFNGKPSGSHVTYRYMVTNNGGPLTNVTGVDDKLGTIFSGLSLGAGQSQTFTASTNLTETTTNTITVTAQQAGGTCTATSAATVTFVPPQPPIAACADLKPIDGIALEFNSALAGGRSIANVAWYKTTVSNINSPNANDLLGNSGPLADGEVFTFDGYAAAGSPLDVDFVVTFTNGTKVRSRFHRSCSDADMNDIADCGKPQGDGRDNNTEGGVRPNIWLLSELLGNGKRLGCQ
jgi:hypothetical protein